jgi:hypothetical protein
MPIITTVAQDSLINIKWQHPDEKDVFQWVVYFLYGTKWDYQILNRKERIFQISKMSADNKNTLTRIAVTAVDRMGNESRRREIQLMN